MSSSRSLCARSSPIFEAAQRVASSSNPPVANLAVLNSGSSVSHLYSSELMTYPCKEPISFDDAKYYMWERGEEAEE